MQIVDAYTHCGLSKYKPIEDVRRTMQAAGVERAVLVQHIGEFDNGYIGTVVTQDPEHFAGVCLVNHDTPDRMDRLRQLKASGHFKGVRLPTEALSAAPDLFHAAAELELIIVLYTPDGIVDFVEPLMEFLKDHRSVRLVLTHMGYPDVSQGPEFNRYKQVFRLAQFQGVYYQISGMKMFCLYPHETLYGLIKEAVEQFGTSRTYWGSNYPVVGDEEEYRKDLRLLLEGYLPVPEEAIPAIAGGNAGRVWFANG